MPQEMIPQRIYKTDDFTENWVKMNQSVLRMYRAVDRVVDRINDIYDFLVYKLKQVYDIVVSVSREFLDSIKSFLSQWVEDFSELFPTIENSKKEIDHTVNTYQHYPHRNVNKFDNKRVNTKGYSHYKKRAVCRGTC